MKRYIEGITSPKNTRLPRKPPKTDAYRHFYTAKGPMRTSDPNRESELRAQSGQSPRTLAVHTL